MVRDGEVMTDRCVLNSAGEGTSKGLNMAIKDGKYERDSGDVRLDVWYECP